MMLLYCSSCGLIFREDDADVEEVDIGEAWGRPITERILICPKCGEVPEDYDGDEDDEHYVSPFADMADAYHPRRNEYD